MAENASDVSLGIVLVVGGTGFVGRHCIRHVQRNGASAVHSLSSRLPADEQRLSNVQYHVHDLGDVAGIEQVVRLIKPTTIIHTASPRPFVEPDWVYERVNIQGTKNLLQACDVAGTPQAYVYCSSVSVIDDGVGDLVRADESWPVLFAPEQKSAYWHSKATAEKLVLEHNRQNSQQMLTTALRVTSIFGEDDAQIIGGLLDSARTGRVKTQIGDGKNLNDWTYVGNVAAAHTLAAKRLLRAVDTPDPVERRVEGEAFFVTNDEPRPFWGFVRQVAHEAGYPVELREIRQLPACMAWIIGAVAEWSIWITSLGRRKSYVCRQQMRFCIATQVFDNTKARCQLGYEPTVDIDEAIRLSVASFSPEPQGGLDQHTIQAD